MSLCAPWCAAAARRPASRVAAATIVALVVALLLGHAPAACRAQQQVEGALDENDFGAALIDSLAAAHGDGGETEEERLESLLHWSISHSDPRKLAAAAGEAEKRQTVADLIAQRAKVKELLDYMNAQPTETDLLKETIAMLVNDSTPEVGRLHALKGMQVRPSWGRPIVGGSPGCPTTCRPPFPTLYRS